MREFFHLEPIGSDIRESHERTFTLFGILIAQLLKLSKQRTALETQWLICIHQNPSYAERMGGFLIPFEHKLLHRPPYGKATALT